MLKILEDLVNCALWSLCPQIVTAAFGLSLTRRLAGSGINAPVDDWNFVPDIEHSLHHPSMSGYRHKATITIECRFVFDVYGFCPNDYSSSAIDEEGATALRETTVPDCLDNDGG
jgi:hypothetical protein